DRAAVRHGLPDEFVRLVDEVQGLLEIDDVDPIALSENEPLHLRVPAPGLVAEVNAALQQLPHGDDRCHTGVPFLLVRRVPMERRARLVLAPMRTHRGGDGHGPKSAHRGEAPAASGRAKLAGRPVSRKACGLADREVVYPVRPSRALVYAPRPFRRAPPGRSGGALPGRSSARSPTGRLTRAGVPDGRRPGAVPP